MSERSVNVGRRSVTCLCSGDPHEMGFSQGVAARPKTVDFGDVLSRLEAFRLIQPAWIPYPPFLRVAERRATRMLVEALRESNRGMLARLNGMAEGVGLPFRKLCLWNAMEAFLSATREVTVAAPVGCCSAASPDWPGRTIPAPVAGLAGVAAIAAGAVHSLAATNDGTVWAWGSNDSGQLGCGRAGYRPNPARVIQPGSPDLAISMKHDGVSWLAIKGPIP